jgi:hypothetical protein
MAAHVRQEIIPEERAAVRIARQVLKQGPTRVITDKDGHATVPKMSLKQIAENMDFVFIRDDGWTVACRNEHRHVAEEMWRGDWVGRMEFVPPDVEGGQYVGYSTLFVYSQQKFEYKVGTMNPAGHFVSAGDVDVSKYEPDSTIKPRTLDEMREWMRKGCPTDDDQE